MFLSLCVPRISEIRNLQVRDLEMTSSGIITVEKLDSCSKDTAEYSIKINDFLRKAKALYPGKGKIITRTILIQNSTFQVEMLLNGKDQLSPVFRLNLLFRISVALKFCHG